MLIHVLYTEVFRLLSEFSYICKNWPYHQRFITTWFLTDISSCPFTNIITSCTIVACDMDNSHWIRCGVDGSVQAWGHITHMYSLDFLYARLKTYYGNTFGGQVAPQGQRVFIRSLSNLVNMLVCIMSRPSSITSQIPPGTPELWPLNCPKTELAVSALQVEYLAPKIVVITIEFTTNMMNVFCVSLALLFSSCALYVL